MNGSFVMCQMSVAIQDILRVFVIRIACLNLDYASLLVKPIISWISHRVSEPSILSDVDTYKVCSNFSSKTYLFLLPLAFIFLLILTNLCIS